MFYRCGLAISLRLPGPQSTSSDLAPSKGYRWSNLHRTHPSDTLVVVTASGGGTRAATLELSVLKALNQIRLQSGDTLADEIDILSSVSGGSVTAAYFSLYGSSGFTNLENNFIRQNGIGSILSSGLNPVGLAKLSTPSVERIDLLINYLDRTLFTKQETFASLLANGRRPYLILNAADMVEGIPFSFTQNSFDLLCSDLSKMHISNAVAASAAFPVALSPVTLKNYSPCPAQKVLPNWPPAWVASDAETEWLTNPERASRGRAALAYAIGANSATPKSYIHLLDGGIADNLGVAEPYRILTTNSPSPGYLNAIAQGDIKKIVFIVINARSFAKSSLDQQQATPGILDMLLGTIDSGIDRTAAGTAQKLRDALGENFNAAADGFQSTHPDMAANLRAMPRNTHLIEIDFDAIADPTCRQNFHNIGTSWTNSDVEINSLLDVGGALLAKAPQFSAMVQAVNGRPEGSFPDLTATCEKLAHK